MRHCLARIGCLFSLLLVPIPVAAQGEPRRPAPTGVENVVVTARKRQESLQDVPVSVTAFSDTALDEMAASRIPDIARSVPNLDFERTVGFSNAARVNIRGVGQTDPIGTLDPGVGLYVDGVYLARAQSSLLAVADIERVEVIRGPQGTVFGKSTIGGAINVVTRKPDFETGGVAELRVGNYDLLETRASLNIPLVDERAAARLSFATATRDGFEKERQGGTDPFDEKLLGARAQLLLIPLEDLEVLLTGDLSRENQVLSPGKCKVLNSGGTPGLQAVLGAVDYTRACADVQASSNPRRVETGASFLRDDLTSYGGSAQLTWSLGPTLQLRSISSVRGLDNENFGDFDGTRIALIRPDIDDVGFQQTQLSQELQLSAQALDGDLNYLAGAFFFREESKDEVREGVLSQLTAQDIVNPFPGLDAASTADAIRGAQLNLLNRVDNLSYSGFAQASYDVTDRLNLTGGLRLTQDRRRLQRRGFALTPGVDTNQRLVVPGDVTTSFDRSSRFSDFTPSAALSYRFSDDVLGYLSYATGFKSGGFNGRAFPAPGADLSGIEFEPEDLTTYEAGLKLTAMSGLLTLNAAAFYSIYEDIQLVVVSGDPAVNNLQILLLNAGESVISGGELELVATPLPNLQIRSAIGLLHDRFKEFDDAADPQAKDRTMQLLSAYQTTTAVEYRFEPIALGALSARVEWSTRSRQFTDVQNRESIKAGKRGLLDARLALELGDGRTQLALYGRNLLDRDYLTGGVDFSDTFGNAQLYTGPPRTYGLEVRREF